MAASSTGAAYSSRERKTPDQRRRSSKSSTTPKEHQLNPEQQEALGLSAPRPTLRRRWAWAASRPRSIQDPANNGPEHDDPGVASKGTDGEADQGSHGLSNEIVDHDTSRRGFILPALKPRIQARASGVPKS